jgi:peptidoglycan/xylan/chitin deacetylase (PgdA/CDA1 family)
MGDISSEANFLTDTNVCTKPTIYLTFDDGPSPNHGTETVLDVLRKNSLKATFFINMKNAKNNPSHQKRLLQRMITEGHTIGNHGYEHADLEGFPVILRHSPHA